MLEVSKINIGSYLCISRKSLGGDISEGIALGCNGEFILLKDYTDFVFGGYHLISTKDVEDIFLPSYYEKIEGIYIKEGWKELDESVSCLKSVVTWKEAATLLQSLNIDAQLEVGSDEIHLGSVISVNDFGLGIIAINCNFSRDDKPFFLRFDELVGIKIKSPYLSIYSKYSS